MRKLLRRLESATWSSFGQVAATKNGERRQSTQAEQPRNSGTWRRMATADDAFRVNRTQEVAGSSPASSTSKRPAQRAFCSLYRRRKRPKLAAWSSFGQGGAKAVSRMKWPKIRSSASSRRNRESCTRRGRSFLLATPDAPERIRRRPVRNWSERNRTRGSPNVKGERAARR